MAVSHKYALSYRAAPTDCVETALLHDIYPYTSGVGATVSHFSEPVYSRFYENYLAGESRNVSASVGVTALIDFGGVANVTEVYVQGTADQSTQVGIANLDVNDSYSATTGPIATVSYYSGQPVVWVTSTGDSIFQRNYLLEASLDGVTWTALKTVALDTSSALQAGATRPTFSVNNGLATNSITAPIQAAFLRASQQVICSMSAANLAIQVLFNANNNTPPYIFVKAAAAAQLTHFDAVYTGNIVVSPPTAPPLTSGCGCAAWKPGATVVCEPWTPGAVVVGDWKPRTSCG